MKTTHNFSQKQETDEYLLDLLSSQKLLAEKTRINLYLPKIIVSLIDRLAQNNSRGELVSSLVVKEIRKKQKLPFGMFSPLEITDKEIDSLTSLWKS